MTTARTARQRARDEITAEILEAGRAQLATVGAGGLSLRAVAREVGMVSSAVYRYFPSRDDLLTALLIGAYDSLGEAAEIADDAVADRTDARSRWMAVCRATRSWAIAHPHEHALLYGSPVTDYAAPRDTVVPAARVIVRLVTIVDATRSAGGGRPAPPDGAAPGFGGSVAGAADAISELVDLDGDLSDELTGRTVMAWSSLIGVISFELWGHLVGSVDDHETFFDGVAARLWHDLGGL